MKLTNFTSNLFNESQQGIDDSFKTLKEVIITTAKQISNAKRHIKRKNNRPKNSSEIKRNRLIMNVGDEKVD